MRLVALTLAAGFATVVASVSANAIPVLPNLKEGAASNIIQAASGCGRGFYRNYRGFCVRNYYRPYRYGYARPYYRPYYPAPRYYGYHRPYRYW
jgi:hypothetical protein